MAKFDWTLRLGKLQFGWIKGGFGFPGKREWKFWWQRRTRGWSDDETWNLYIEVARFTLPRLKRFREITIAHPVSLKAKEWDTILGKMEFAFQSLLDEEDGVRPENETEGQSRSRHQRVQEGLKLFGRYFQGLWW